MMPFTIEAEYCNKDEVDDQLQELLFSYRELYQPGLGKELEDNEQQYREIERKSEIAFLTLQSIFPDCPKITSEKLQGNGDGAFKRILDRLRRLAKKIEWPSGAADGKWTATAASSAECHEKVAYFMQNGLWPLTNVVRYAYYSNLRRWGMVYSQDSSSIYLSAQVLKSGIVLADLPGMFPFAGSLNTY